jgi:hypothetical protein
MALTGLVAANNLGDVVDIERTWDNIGNNISATVFVPAATLDLNFAGNKSLVDNISGSGLVTFTRASSGTFVGSNGLIQNVASGVPRFDHDPATGESLGLLVEEPRTNSLVYSQTSTGWGATTMLNSAGTAPDGTNTAMLATDNAGFRYSLGAGTFTYSFFVKQGTSSTVRLIWAGYGGIDWTFTFATQSLVVAGAWSNASVARYTNGWYRISATTSSRDLYYYLLYAESASSTFYLWGCQGEAGSFPTSYIPTTTIPLLRSADVVSITGTNFSSWYRQDEGTLLTKIIPSLKANLSLWTLSDGTTVERMLGYSDSAFNFYVDDNSVNQVNIGGFPFTVNSANTSAAAYKINNFAYSRNGSTVAVDTSGSVPTPTRLQIMAAFDASGTHTGTIARLAFYPVRLSNITLQALTTLGPVSSFPYSFSIKGRDILALKEVNKTSTRDFIFIKGLLSKAQPRINTASQYTTSGVVLRNAAMLKVAPTTAGNYFFSPGLTLSGTTVHINGTNALSIGTSPFSGSTATVPLLFAGLRPQTNWRFTEPMTSGTVVSPESAIPIETSDFLLFIKAGQS